VEVRRVWEGAFFTGNFLDLFTLHGGSVPSRRARRGDVLRLDKFMLELGQKKV